MYLSFNYQIVETKHPKELEFPQEALARRRKRLKPGASQWGNLSPRKIFHTELTTCQTTLLETEPQTMMSQWWA